MDNTPEHLRPFERAARIYCQKVGIDPDGATVQPHPVLAGMTVSTPQWHEVAAGMLELNLMLLSIREAALQEVAK